MKILPRREFLWQALAACGTAWAAPARLVEAAQSAPIDRAARAGTAYIGGNADAVRAIGEAYLRQLGREANRDSLLAAARGTIEVINRSRNERGAIGAIVRAVRQDFERGHSVQLEGWILSRTEAEICVLTLLSESTSS